MRVLVFLFFSVCAASFCSVSLAGPISTTSTTYVIESDANLRWGDDVLGLDGGALQFVTTPGQLVRHSEPFTSFAAGQRSLRLTDTDYDGVHGASRINSGTWTVDGRDYDALRFGGTRYQIGPYELEIRQMSVNFAAGFLNDGPDRLPSFTMDDVSAVSWFELKVWSNRRTVARYGSTYGTLAAYTLTQGPDATVAVPEPSSALLLGAGLLALVWRRRLNLAKNQF